MKTYKVFAVLVSVIFSSALIADDAAIFKKKCGFCHTVTGVSKGKIGPDLTGFVGKRPAGYIKDYSADPNAAKSKYPDIYEKEVKGKFKSAMPATKTTDAEMQAILNILK